MGVIKVDENDPVGELEPSFPFRDVKILHNVDVRDFYDLKEEIGRGKFGTVYRCVEKKTGIVLAAKFVPIAKKQDRINVEREVEIMRTLQHPRLIQIYDAFEIHNVMCVVLELIEGGELFERVIDDDFILTEKACAVFMRQICEGVSFIHQNKIIHLDLKPENILCLTKTGNRIKIIDFGLARKYDPNKKLQVLFGTPEFVAPEVVNFDEITSATDMWSVGVICYVLLSGLSPFMGENDLQTMTNVTMAQYDFDDEAFDCISADAKDFISKLLVKNKEKRLNAGECANHPWLKRKPPPPMYLEQSKENLKTYVDSMHSSSPFLLSETLSNGTINSEGYIVPPPELVTPKAPTENPNKPVPVIVTPEIIPLVDNHTMSPNEQNLKIQNEINLIKSSENLPTLVKDPVISNLVVPPSSSSDTKTDITNEDKENISKKAVKTDSFKELPRKFSITASDGSRELPRRASLTRADKAKEIKRETFVTFVGPREIKPVDSISLDVKHVVEELTTFIKSNIEESSLLKLNHDSTNTRESFVEINSSASSSNSLNEKNICKESSNKIGLKSIAEGSVVKTESAHVSSCSSIDSNKSSKTNNKINKEDVTTPLLRPADYLKLTNKSIDSFNVSTPLGDKLAKDNYVSFKPKSMTREVDNNVLLSKDQLMSKTNNMIQTYSSESLKSIEKSEKVFGKVVNLDNKSQIFKSIESPKSFDSNLKQANDKKVTTPLSRQSSTSSFAKDISYTSKSSVVSSMKDSPHVTSTSSRNQSVFESKKKSSVGDVSDSLSNFKSSESSNIYSYFSSSAIRGDSTLPRKSQIFRQNENTSTTKENTPAPSSSENKRTRATSLDPTPVGSSWSLSNDSPFQSRFLRSASQFKTESNYKSSSEVVSNKYEEFRNKYSNYKDLVMDNEKLVKKSFISERMTPSRSSEKVEDSSKNQATTSQSQSSSSKQTPTTYQSSTLPSYSLRQKFNLDDQKRDLSKYDFRSSKLESTFSKDRFTQGTVSSVKESTSSKFSQISTQKSESKVSLPEKCPTSPQKSL